MKICLQKKNTKKIFRLIVINNKKKIRSGKIKDILGIFWYKNQKNKEFSLNLFRLIFWISYNNIKISKKGFSLISNFLI